MHARNCDYDYLEIREGGVATGPVVGRYCGRDTPLPYVSSSNMMYLNFRSDYSVSRSGFRIRYKTGEITGCFKMIVTKYVASFWGRVHQSQWCYQTILQTIPNTAQAVSIQNICSTRQCHSDTVQVAKKLRKTRLRSLVSSS